MGIQIDLARPDHAYFFGFAQTDGSMSANTRNRGSMAFELSDRDVHILHAFKAMFPSNAAISFRTRDTNFKKEYTSVCWRLHDQGLREQLIELGVPVGRKSNVVTPPIVPFSVRDYTRGLFDGDGSMGFEVHGYPLVSFTTKSPMLAEFVLRQIKDVTGGVRTSTPNKRDNIYNITLGKELAATFAAWLYQDGDLALDRKMEAVRKMSAWSRPEGMRVAYKATAWTPEEDAVVKSLPTKEAAAALGRTYKSVNIRRWRLKNANP